MPYASADHIAEWGRRGGAERLLPELLLRLIQATTADRSPVRIRTGEGIFMGGWDCISDVGRGNEYVPDGTAGWELGTECPPGSKAKGDYDGRKKEPKPLEPATSVTSPSRRVDRVIAGASSTKATQTGCSARFGRTTPTICTTGCSPPPLFTCG